MNAASLHQAANQERRFYALLALGLVVLGVGLAAAHLMDLHGHVITGMNNQVVWGLPHVFAIFLIVAASGALNVASVGSVFGQTAYKPHAPLSALLSVALLAGGLMVLLLDLGRPERLLIAATHFNFKSVFAWNVFLYSGLFALVGVYLWTLLERRLNPHARSVGLAVLVWRLTLTTATGSIFGLLVARQAYQSALLAPLFIVLSLGWGLAVFLLVQAAMLGWQGRGLPAAWSERVARLLGIFVLAALYMVAIHHLTNLYFARQIDFELFILIGRGAPDLLLPGLLWLGYGAVGTLLPLLLLFHPRLRGPRALLWASALVVLGAFALLYVFIIGGQVFPLEIFPGHVVSSSFFDGAVDPYRPSLPEWLLGLGGIAAAYLLTLVGLRVLPLMPAADAPPAKEGA